MFTNTSHDKELKSIAINMKNMSSRLSKVINFKENSEILRRKKIRDLEEERLDEKTEKVKVIVKELEEIYESKIIRSYQTTLNVLNHHKKRVMSLLPLFEEDEFIKGSKDAFIIFDEIYYKIEKKILPLLEKQIYYLKSFEKNLNLSFNEEFLKYYRAENEFYEYLWKETNIKMKACYRLNNKSHKLMKKYNNYKENHPRTALVFDISFEVLSLISLGITLKVVIKSIKLIKLFKYPFKIMKLSNKPLDNINFKNSASKIDSVLDCLSAA